MYARVTTVRTQPGKVEEAISIARDSIAPHAQEQQGFNDLLALASSEDEEVIFLSLWETEDDLITSEDSGYYEDQLGKLSRILAGRAFREAYEVSNLA